MPEVVERGRRPQRTGGLLLPTEEFNGDDVERDNRSASEQVSEDFTDIVQCIQETGQISKISELVVSVQIPSFRNVTPSVSQNPVPENENWDLDCEYNGKKSIVKVTEDDNPGKKKPINDPYISYTRDPQWPHKDQRLHPRKMIEGGWTFTGKGDMVECKYCGASLENWTGTMNPMERHFSKNPNCSLSYQSSLSRIQGAYNSGSQNRPVSLYGQSSVKTSQPNYHKYEARLETFHGYSPSLPVSKQRLAAAGFIFQRQPDYTKCFACDMVLKDWEPGDDPMDEHRKLAPGCPFIQVEDRVEMALPYKYPKLPSQQPGTYGPPQLKSKEPKLTSSLFNHVEPLASKYDKVDSRDDYLQSYDPNMKPTYNYGNPSAIQSNHLHKKSSSSYTYPKSHEYSEDSSSFEYPIKDAKSFTEPFSSNPLESTQASIRYPPSKAKEDDFESFQPNSVQVQNMFAGSLSQFSDLSLKPESEMKLCKICMDHDIDAIFLPCGHVYCCSNCASAVTTCPFCRKPVKSTTKAYLPF